MNWIKEEAEERQRLEQEQEAQGNYLVGYSNFWANLVRQLEKDIQEINSEPIWQPLLASTPIKIMDWEGGYKIEKRTEPAFSIYVKNGGKKITVRTIVIGIIEEKTRDTTDTLEVVESNGQVFLKKYNETFVVPEQASQFILSPIVEALKRKKD